MGLATASRRVRSLALGAAVSVWILAQAHAALVAAGEGGFVRVRSSDATITDLIGLATSRSRTFRNLMALIQSSDGIVHVEPGECGHGTHACLKIWMGVAGSTRFLRVVVDRRRGVSEVDFMGSIGHELQHSVEALSEPGTVDSVALYNFFSRVGTSASDRFETAAAINAGDAVRRELRGWRGR